MSRRAYLLILLVVSLCMVYQASAQSLSAVLPPSVEIVYEDAFDEAGLAKGWHAWENFPQVADGMMTIQGWNSWNNAVVRPDYYASKGALQLFRYEPGAMEFFLDYGDYSDPAYRNIRLGTSGDGNWHVYTSAGAGGVNTRTYGSAHLLPGHWYYLLVVIAHDGHFYLQVWEQGDPAANYLLNMDLAPSGEGWADRHWWFGSKVYDGQLTLDYFAELHLVDDFTLPCTVRAAGTVNRRGGPGTQYETVGSIASDDNFQVVGQWAGLGQQVWWQLADQSWVRSDVVRASGSCDDLPEAAF